MTKEEIQDIVQEQLQHARRGANAMSRAISIAVERFSNALERRSWFEKAGLTVGSLLLIVAVDVAFGFNPELEHLFYLPIWYAAWFMSRRAAYAAAAFSIAWTWVIPVLRQEPYSMGATLGLVTAVFMFSLSAWLISLLREVFNRERRRARVDFLTNCLNAHGFYEVSEDLFSTSRVAFRPFAFVYIDLDKFKQLNDTVGHLEADKALRLVGRALRAATRRQDFVARVGGDEFVALLNGIGADMAFAAAERILRRLESDLDRHGYALSASVGCMAFNEVPPSVKSALKLADAIMYESKRNSGGQVRRSVWPADSNGEPRRQDDRAYVR